MQGAAAPTAVLVPEVLVPQRAAARAFAALKAPFADIDALQTVLNCCHTCGNAGCCSLAL